MFAEFVPLGAALCDSRFGIFRELDNALGWCAAGERYGAVKRASSGVFGRNGAINPLLRKTFNLVLE